MDLSTRFVVGWLALLFLLSWAISMDGLFQAHFWDKQHAYEMLTSVQPEDIFFNSTALPADVASSYFTERRYFIMLPHVIGAIIWWNLYFVQLLPKVRHQYPLVHRCLGRMLMLAAISQAISGIGMAATSHSSTIKIVSYMYGVSILYCIYHAWKFAYVRDIPKHKFWASRLVGYLQGIALQRFWMVLLIGSYHAGWRGLYASIDGQSQKVVDEFIYQIFDDSFVGAVLQALLFTEWYLSLHSVQKLQLSLASSHDESTSAKKVV